MYLRSARLPCFDATSKKAPRIRGAFRLATALELQTPAVETEPCDRGILAAEALILDVKRDIVDREHSRRRDEENVIECVHICSSSEIDDTSVAIDGQAMRARKSRPSGGFFQL
jgi:hypothetical protein